MSKRICLTIKDEDYDVLYGLRTVDANVQEVIREILSDFCKNFKRAKEKEKE